MMLRETEHSAWGDRTRLAKPKFCDAAIMIAASSNSNHLTDVPDQASRTRYRAAWFSAQGRFQPCYESKLYRTTGRISLVQRVGRILAVEHRQTRLANAEASEHPRHRSRSATGGLGALRYVGVVYGRRRSAMALNRAYSLWIWMLSGRRRSAVRYPTMAMRRRASPIHMIG